MVLYFYHVRAYTLPVKRLILSTFSLALLNSSFPVSLSIPKPNNAMTVASKVLTFVPMPSLPLPCLRSGANRDGDEDVGLGSGDPWLFDCVK